MNDIKALRKEKKLTQEQASKLTGISLRTYFYAFSYDTDFRKFQKAF